MKPEMTPEDIGLVARIREGYQPPPMTDMERRRFDARLRARIESQQRRRMWGFGGLALTAAAAAALFFAARQTEAPGPAPSPGPQPAMAAAPTESPQADGEAIALDWLVDEARADWLGGSTVLPADPLELAALEGISSAVAAETADAEADGADDADDSPEWMPAEYDLLASLIEIEPYDPYAEDWP